MNNSDFTKSIRPEYSATMGYGYYLGKYNKSYAFILMSYLICLGSLGWDNNYIILYYIEHRKDVAVVPHCLKTYNMYQNRLYLL